MFDASGVHDKENEVALLPCQQKNVKDCRDAEQRSGRVNCRAAAAMATLR